MVTWGLLYLFGCFAAMSAVGLMAFKRRAAHGMQSRSVAQLTLSAGLVWPLLAVAGVQVAGLLALKTVLSLVRNIGGSAAESESVDTSSTVTLESAVAVAA